MSSWARQVALFHDYDDCDARPAPAAKGCASFVRRKRCESHYEPLTGALPASAAGVAGGTVRKLACCGGSWECVSNKSVNVAAWDSDELRLDSAVALALERGKCGVEPNSTYADKSGAGLVRGSAGSEWACTGTRTTLYAKCAFFDGVCRAEPIFNCASC